MTDTINQPGEEPAVDWETFDFYTIVDAVTHETEARYIKLALDASEGFITKAAALLHIKHQTLCNMLNTRHAALRPPENPKKKRKVSIIDHSLFPDKKRKGSSVAGKMRAGKDAKIVAKTRSKATSG